MVVLNPAAGNHSRPGGPLRTLLIAAEPDLAEAFLASAARAPDPEVEVAARVDSYPEEEDLSAIAESVCPDVAAVDVAGDLAAACRVIRSLASAHPEIHSIALHHRNDRSTLMQVLRMGATEFLCAPFLPDELRAAAARIRRLRRGSERPRKAGVLLAFASGKPGSGASTLARQTALALRNLTAERVLLADFNLFGGCPDLAPKPGGGSLAEALRNGPRLDGAGWSTLTRFVNRIEVLPAPEWPPREALDLNRLEPLLESARANYGWVVLDLPVVFQPLSLAALRHCGRRFVVSTAGLPSLHMTRRALDWLNRNGIPPGSVETILNRHAANQPVDCALASELLGCPVSVSLPEDYRSLHQLEALERLPSASRLGEAVEGLARRLAREREAEALAPVA